MLQWWFTWKRSRRSRYLVSVRCPHLPPSHALFPASVLPFPAPHWSQLPPPRPPFPRGWSLHVLSLLLLTGHNDAHLRCIEVHSQTLIQLESWFTATGQTRVTVVGPPRARQWLMDMIWSLGNWDPYQQDQGRDMLHRVRSQPLTQEDLTSCFRVQPSTGDLSLATRMSGNISLGLPPASPLPQFSSF
uniref:KH-like RNA-binding domain-containing protein n=1 Tax=Oryctolagus cuniculus TaxID=9986 RepID=A0A5F9D5G5_RABIT